PGGGQIRGNPPPDRPACPNRAVSAALEAAPSLRERPRRDRAAVLELRLRLGSEDARMPRLLHAQPPPPTAGGCYEWRRIRVGQLRSSPIARRRISSCETG